MYLRWISSGLITCRECWECLILPNDIFRTSPSLHWPFSFTPQKILCYHLLIRPCTSSYGWNEATAWSYGPRDCLASCLSVLNHEADRHSLSRSPGTQNMAESILTQLSATLASALGHMTSSLVGANSRNSSEYHSR